MARVINVHERELRATPEQVGALIDSLASSKDALWPNRSWPRMKFDRPLGVGANGGHGPIGYFVEQYAPGRSIQFRFTNPKGFDGVHRYELIGKAGRSTVLRHTIDMTTHGPALLTWALVFRPLHDALLEDSLATAETSLGQVPQRLERWSPWVKLLRWILTKGTAGPQMLPANRLR